MRLDDFLARISRISRFGGTEANCNRRKVLAVQIIRMTQRGLRSEMIGSSLNGGRNSGQGWSLCIMKL